MREGFQYAVIGLGMGVPLLGASIEFVWRRKKDPLENPLVQLGMFLAYLAGMAIVLSFCFYAAYTMTPHTSYVRLGEAYDKAFLIGWGIASFCIALVTYGRCKTALTRQEKIERDWHYDEASGEFFPVLNRRGPVVLYQTKTYKERAVKAELERLERDGSKMASVYAFGFAALFYGLGKIYQEHWLGWVFWAFCFGSVVMFVPFFLKAMASAFMPAPDPGPAPAEPLNRKQEVEEQRVYGAGGFATPDEAIAAARGRSTGKSPHSADQQFFED